MDIGQQAFNFTLLSSEGRPVSLQEILNANQAVLLIFLRHLGWLPCREHVAQVRDHHKEIEALGATVLFLSFGQVWQAKRWLEETGVSYPLLLDPERRIYQAYRLKRSILKAWHPRIFLYYFRLLWKGRRLRPVQGDPYQLGGDFIVDKQGILRYAHPSVDPLDRPDITEVLNALENACQMP